MLLLVALLSAVPPSESDCFSRYVAQLLTNEAIYYACEQGPYEPTTGEPCPDWPECCLEELKDANLEAWNEFLDCLGGT